ncbi:transmembrane protein 116 isoform X1 [Carcharodon carcharias]|uniref:transmembrane protein 116 isoform X1 n=1 Tax=Carcharodon carcharias TaxID=13397 RepID=UPI001B7EA552|nr:transmembrane protein 116 isoform X1 [Carcharodon carcharias]
MEHLSTAMGRGSWTLGFSIGTEEHSSEFYVALRWIQFSMVVLSLIGSGSIIGYVALQQLARHPEIRPLFYLSLSDLMLGVCWLIGVLLYGESFSTQSIACYNLQVIGQVLYISSFCYTLNYTWCLYRDLRSRIRATVNDSSCLKITESSNRLSRIVIKLSSLIPLLLMVPVFCIGNGYGCYANLSNSCLLLHTGMLELNSSYNRVHKNACHSLYLYRTTIFLISFCFTLLGLVILLIKTRILYKKLVTLTGFLGDQQWAKISVIERRVFLYPTAFLFCWGPATILAVIKLLKPTNMPVLYVILYILQAFTAASQGLLNCIVYGWTQRTLQYVRQKARRDVDTQTPLLRSQKRSYSSMQNSKSLYKL